MSSDLSDRVVPRYKGSTIKFDLESFVDDVADRYEKSKRGMVQVSSAARHELVRRMRPHERELRRDLASGEMSPRELSRIMAEVLIAAKPVKRVARMGRNPSTGSEVRVSRSRIDRQGVLIAMKWKCRYLGWC
jgi:hypothetical protein